MDEINTKTCLEPKETAEEPYYYDETTEIKSTPDYKIEEKVEKLKTAKFVIILICIAALIFCGYKSYTSYAKSEYYEKQAVYYRELRNYAGKLADEYEELVFELNGTYSSYIYSEYSYFKDLYDEYNNDYIRFNQLSEKYDTLSIIYFIATAISIFLPFIVSNKIKEQLIYLSASPECTEENRNTVLDDSIEDDTSDEETDEQEVKHNKSNI